jgi:hypothetical protein
MSNELTEAERAAVNAAHWYCHHDGPATGTDSLCQDCENIARAIVAAVQPIIAAEALENMANELEPHVNIEHQEVWPFVQELRAEAYRLRNP